MTKLLLHQSTSMLTLYNDIDLIEQATCKNVRVYYMYKNVRWLLTGK